MGCVIVAGGRPVASARTAAGGRPHAEIQALAAAGGQARGAVAYLSLEPCAHDGETPSCAGALVEAGIARVVAALEDPDPRTAGRGFARLREAGIEVCTDPEMGGAREIIAGHARRVTSGRPYVTLKIAASLDGAVAAGGRRRTAITGARARAWVESLRSEHDAVLVGSGTVAVDDPLLLPLDPGLAGCLPLRVVLDTRLTAVPGSRLLASTDRAPVWVCHGAEADASPLAGIEGVTALPIPEAEGGLDLGSVLSELGRRGLGRVLCEAGPRLAAALVGGGHVDEILWLTAGRTCGTAGLAALGGDAPGRFHLAGTRVLGGDVASSWQPQPESG